jgi:hypothetical protein
MYRQFKRPHWSFIPSAFEQRAPMLRRWFEVLSMQPGLIPHWLLSCALEIKPGLPQSQ